LHFPLRNAVGICPSKSIPAKQIEDFVIEQIKKIGYALELIQDVVTSVADKMKGQLKQLEDERLALGRDTARWNNQRWNARCTELDKPTRPFPALFLNWPDRII